MHGAAIYFGDTSVDLTHLWFPDAFGKDRVAQVVRTDFPVR
jgi:hypothetical protein